MIQIKRRSDIKRGYRIMPTICFYQDARHKNPLLWIKRTLGIGYISDRSDQITELRINGFSQVERILRLLSPYVRFKIEQVRIMLQALALLQSKPNRQLTTNDLERLFNLIIEIRSHNYKSQRRKSEESLRKVLGLTP